MKVKFKIHIIGSGVVGQATGKSLAKRGHNVSFIDINLDTINMLKADGLNALSPDEAKNNFNADISLLTVPTPTIGDRISLVPLKSAVKSLAERIKVIKKYHVVVVRSTVPPETTENIVIKLLEKYSGKKVGQDFGVCMNPEYLREVSAFADFDNPWIVVIGQYDKKSGDTIEQMYKKYKIPIHRVGLREAEIQKYIHNLYNACKISFFNEMRKVCKKIDADPDAIFQLTVKSCEGIWNGAYGTRDFGPFSGSCLPKDTQAFLYWAQMKNFDVTLLDATIKVNNSLKRAKIQIKDINAVYPTLSAAN